MTNPKQYFLGSSCRVEFIGHTANVRYFAGSMALRNYYELTIPISDLPNWIARRVAVLSSLEKNSKHIDGVGKRLLEYVYWVTKEGDDGDDTGKES